MIRNHCDPGTSSLWTERPSGALEKGVCSKARRRRATLKKLESSFSLGENQTYKEGKEYSFEVISVRNKVQTNGGLKKSSFGSIGGGQTPDK